MLEEAPDYIPKILICILCGYERHNWISPQLLDFVVSLKYNQNYSTHVTKAYNFIPAAGARNFLASQVKKVSPRPDWVLQLDNDMGVPDNILDSIKDAPDDAAIVVPRFHLWDGDNKRTKLCWGMDDSIMKTYKDGSLGIFIEKDKYYELTKCGTGAIFIRPDVFEKIDPPWFEYRFDKLGNMTGTEDITFCEKVLAAGMKIYGWGGCIVSHFHTMDIASVASILHPEVEIKAEDSDDKQLIEASK